MNNIVSAITRIQRARGALLGLAVGDAIGTTVEFKPRGSFAPLTDMVGGGPFNLQPGQWTDDTSMALCLGYSLLEKDFDLDDQMQRYLRWHDTGYLASNGRCFDIGNTTYNALERYRRTGNAEAGSTSPRSAGNGSIMRLAPVPIYYMDTPEQAIAMSEAQSSTTHRASECLQACRLLAAVLVSALQGQNKNDALAAMALEGQALTGALRDVALGQFKAKTIDQIQGSGYVVRSLEAALWCFWHTDNFKSCVLLAANLGDDADTTAAIAGQMAGAFYGEGGIPVAWLQRLSLVSEIRLLAEQLTPVKPSTTVLSPTICRTPYPTMEASFGHHSLSAQERKERYANYPEPATCDPLLTQARDLVIKHQMPSISFLQRQLKIGFNRATALIRCFEGELVTPPDATGMRQMMSTGARSPDDSEFEQSDGGSSVKFGGMQASISVHSLLPEECAQHQRHNQPMDLHHYLQQNRESCPDWLQKFEEGDKFNREQFFGSRVVYYPGSGSDGHPVKLFGSTHSSHCFVYVDYQFEETSVRAQLDGEVPRRDRGSRPFRGYHSLARLSLSETDLAPAGWLQHVHHLEHMRFSNDFKPYAFLEILERDVDFDDDHGAHRLAILFLGADGIASYDALFCQENGVQPPFAVLIQEHGFGGNYDKFGRDGLLERIALECKVFPKFLLVAEGSASWVGYEKMTQLSGSVGGVAYKNRFLHGRIENEQPS